MVVGDVRAGDLLSHTLSHSATKICSKKFRHITVAERCCIRCFLNVHSLRAFDWIIWPQRSPGCHQQSGTRHLASGLLITFHAGESRGFLCPVFFCLDREIVIQDETRAGTRCILAVHPHERDLTWEMTEVPRQEAQVINLTAHAPVTSIRSGGCDEVVEQWRLTAGQTSVALALPSASTGSASPSVLTGSSGGCQSICWDYRVLKIN